MAINLKGFYVSKTAEKIKPLMVDLMKGNVLVKDRFQKQIPFVVFLLMLSLFYVNNRFSYEEELRDMNRLKAEWVDKRYRSLTISKELMDMGRQSHIQQRLKAKGSDLGEAITPLIIIKE